MNKLYSISFLYVILRDIGVVTDPTVSIGFMRQTGPPWKTGKGVQLCLGKYILQIGVCRSPKELRHVKDDDGLLYAMQGRLLEEDPNKIGSW